MTLPVGRAAVNTRSASSVATAQIASDSCAVASSATML
jgi:hypothetical protein